MVINIQQRSCSTENNCEEWTELVSLLDGLTSKIAERYDLFSNGQPRKAMIVEILARNICIACADRELRNRVFQRIDAIYNELHRLASNLLVEALYEQFVSSGQKVIIATEAKIKFGTADILIIASKRGISLLTNQSEIVVEIKTGYSLSITQLLRYLIDMEHRQRSLVVWRVRNAQVFTLEGPEIRRLVLLFTRMIILRAERLLQAQEIDCDHVKEQTTWVPNSQHVQESLSDFSKGIAATMPDVIAKIIAKIGENLRTEQGAL